jgi:hypothetical protein
MANRFAKIIDDHIHPGDEVSKIGYHRGISRCGGAGGF